MILSQDVKIHRVIDSCRNIDHLQSTYQFIRLAMIPLQEKVWWTSILQDKTKHLGYNWTEVTTNELST